MISGNTTSATDRRRHRRLPISVPGVTTSEGVGDHADAVLSKAGHVTTVEASSRNACRRPTGGDVSFDTKPAIPLGKVAGFGFLGAFLIALSLSPSGVGHPIGLGQLAFFAVAPWSWLTLDARRLGTAGYSLLFLSGMFQWAWLYLVEIDLGEGALLSTVPLIAYLATYVPLFVWHGRLARSLLRLPAYLTLPAIWCGLEWLRCHLFGGFSLGLLAHAAADTRRILQLTDLIGSYGLGMLMVASGASVAELIWVARRIRHLERRLPASQSHQPVSGSGGRDSSPRILSGGFLGRPAKKNLDVQASMLAALRRNRDQARGVHLMSVTLLVSVIVGVLVFANFYGRSRVVETRVWKLFESSLFGITVVGGEEAEDVFEEEVKRKERSLLIGCFEEPRNIRLIRRPVLAIHRSAASQSSWQVALHRSEKVSSCRDLEIPPDAQGWKALGFSEMPTCRFMGQPDSVPLNLFVTVAPSFSVEQTVNDRLRAEHEKGKWVDAMIVAVEPGWLDGSRWPRLLTRSVIAGAVANRCPIIASVPGTVIAVANGEGDLWWSSALPSRSLAGNPLTEGGKTQDPIRVQAMIDPRVSDFVSRAGSLPGVICLLLTLLLPMHALLRWILRQGGSRFSAGKNQNAVSEVTTAA